jgi:hypothetical protein
MEKKSFYICENCLLVYETKESAREANIIAASASRGATACTVWGYYKDKEEWANYWARRVSSKVMFSDPNEPILVLKKEEKFWNVIIGEKIGWIIVSDFTAIMPLVGK